MKKISLVLFAVMMAALLAFGASAEVTNYETDTDASFDVTYTGTAGAYYAIVAVEGIVAENAAPTITEDNIQFIDQKTAGAGGSVTFEDILLKEDGTACSIFLGGSDLPKAVLLGYVNKVDEVVTFTVSGNVTAHATGATITITDTTDAEKVYTGTSTNSGYSVEVPAGTYNVVVTLNGHTSYKKNGVAVSANTSVDATLIGGDTDASGSVNDTDLTNVLGDFGKTEGFVAGCDINSDGSVNDSDLTIVLGSFGSVAIEE